MKPDTADALTFPLLALASSAVALVLDHHQQTTDAAMRWEPDGVIVEYSLITGMCMLAGTVRARLASVTPHDTERAFVLAALVGYAPIAVWHCARSYQRQQQRADTWHQLYVEERELQRQARRRRQR